MPWLQPPRHPMHCNEHPSSQMCHELQEDVWFQDYELEMGSSTGTGQWGDAQPFQLQQYTKAQVGMVHSLSLPWLQCLLVGDLHPH